ncbi:MAG TPA: CocE/NonD family hydrolase [Solirubrobacterales bacterium]|nr:CocE/NonD family hydrolase [Solirubrobacterales bacterium]
MAALAVVGVLVVAPAAQAAPVEEVFGGDVECEVLPANGGITECNGDTLSFDGTKISVNVFLPPESLGAGPFPTVGDFHGWGGAKQGLKTTVIGAPNPETPPLGEQQDARIQHWAEEGYVVFSMSDRGWGESCGQGDQADLGKPECEQGWNHLMDDRYEVRDAQYLMSVLADEGLVQPKKIGVTGVSYGGGLSIALGALRNREMLAGGELVPWTSPEGTAMEIAAAVPQWSWSDISSALAPNGRNLDYVTNSPYRGPTGKLPIGVMKFSYTEGLYKTGAEVGRFSPNTFDSIPIWRERLRGGDPYVDALSNTMIEELSTYHSAFGIDHSEAPSPMLLQNGWNDDLFPVDEALRYYQRTRAQYPGDPISLFLADYGHSRSQDKTADVIAFNARLEEWFAHYLKGEGSSPSSSVEALTTTCPSSAPSGGPYTAANWSSLAPGEISLQSSGPQTIGHLSAAEEQKTAEEGFVNPAKFNPVSAVFDPIIGPIIGKSVCSSVPDIEQPLSANYRLGAAPAGGYTLMGSPTIIANIDSPSPNSEIAARLVDVSPEGTETLIARGVYRPTGGPQEMVFQLHPQAYRFAPGHVAKLELMSSDVPYARWSNLQTNVTINGLEMRLPVTDAPGSLGGLVRSPAPKVVPPGYELAAEYQQPAAPNPPSGGGAAPAPTPPAPVKIGFAGIAGKLTANGKAVLVPVRCSADGPCTGTLSFSTKKSGKKGSTVIARGNYSVAAGTATNVRLPLTSAGKKVVKNEMAAKKKKLSGVLQLQDAGRANTLTLNRAAQLPRGK